MIFQINRRGLIANLAALPLLAVPSMVHSVEKALNVKNLKPGSFIWQPDLAPSGPVTIIVSLSEQLAYVYRNGVRIGVTTVSSGRKGFETPTGVFTIYLKETMHHSEKYDNAPMPYSEFFDKGAALHAGGLPGYPSSHGCVHLPKQFASLLYGVTHDGTPVIVTNEHFGMGNLTHAGLLFGDKELKALAQQEGGARVVKASTGQSWSNGDACSIVVSNADRKLYIMRNGNLFHEAPVKIGGFGKLGEHVLQLESKGLGGMKWFAVNTSGGNGFTNNASLALSRVKLSPGQKMFVSSLVHPGSTMVLTDLPSGEHSRTGADFVVVNVKA